MFPPNATASISGVENACSKRAAEISATACHIDVSFSGRNFIGNLREAAMAHAEPHRRQDALQQQGFRKAVVDLNWRRKEDDLEACCRKVLGLWRIEATSRAVPSRVHRTISPCTSLAEISYTRLFIGALTLLNAVAPVHGRGGVLWVFYLAGFQYGVLRAHLRRGRSVKGLDNAVAVTSVVLASLASATVLFAARLQQMVERPHY